MAAAESTGIEIPLLVCREFYVGVKGPEGHGWARWAGSFPHQGLAEGLGPQSGEVTQAHGAAWGGSETPPFSARNPIQGNSLRVNTD